MKRNLYFLIAICIFLFCSCELTSVNDINSTEVSGNQPVADNSDFDKTYSHIYKVEFSNCTSADISTDMELLIDVLRAKAVNLNIPAAEFEQESNDTIRFSYKKLGTLPSDEDLNALFITPNSSNSALTFRDSDGNIVLNSLDVSMAYESFGVVGGVNSEHHVIIYFTDEGADKFYRATADAAQKIDEGKNFIDIFLDNEIISHAAVYQPLSGNSCSITGSFTEKEAAELCDLINYSLISPTFTKLS